MKLLQAIQNWFKPAVNRAEIDLEYHLPASAARSVVSHLRMMLKSRRLEVFSELSDQVQCTAYGRGYHLHCSTGFGSRNGQDCLLLWIRGWHTDQAVLDELVESIEENFDIRGKVDYSDRGYPNGRDLSDSLLVR